MEQAGYRLQDDFDYLDRQSFLIFKSKPSAMQLSQTPGLGSTSQADATAR
jgi:hypothetical protein